MRARSASRALVLLLATVLLVPGCLPIRTEAPAVPSGPREEPRLRPLLPLDARGEAVVRGRLLSFSEDTTDRGWRGAIEVVYPSWIDGSLGDAEVRAEVATGTPVSGTTAAGVPDRIARLAQQQAVVEVRVRKEGGTLRALRVSAVAALPAEAPRATGALRLDAGGQGTYRGLVSDAPAKAGSGTLRLHPSYRVYGIELRLSVPVRWGGDTTLVTLKGERTPLPDALRAAPDLFASTPVEVRYRRRPDGLVAEEVRQYVP